MGNLEAFLESKSPYSRSHFSRPLNSASSWEFLIKNPAALERVAAVAASVWGRSFYGSGGRRIRDTSLISFSTSHRPILVPAAAERKRVMSH